MPGPETRSHMMAHSFRSVVGPPTRATSAGSALAFEAEEDPSDTDAVSMVDVGPEPVVGPAPPAPEKPRGLPDVSFVLLLGMDNRNDRVTGRTDTMVIAAFRHRDGKVGAFSVPRDLWVELPELGPARISSVVRVGNARVGAGEGIPLLRSVIEREFGIRVDRYAAVDLVGFVGLVDQVGGVEVEVRCPIVDCLWMGSGEEACEELALEAGTQTLDGSTALKYVRSRHGRGDRDRRRRQQAVLIGFGRAVRDGGLLGLRELWEKAEPYVETDLEWDSAAYYASFALETDLGALNGFSVSKSLVSRHVTEKKQHVLLLDRDAFDQALRGMFRGRLPGLRERKRCPAADAAATARAHR